MTLLAATGLSVAVLNLIMKPSRGIPLSGDQSYEMPRPPSNVRAYDLSGRNIVRVGEDSKSSPTAAEVAVGGQPVVAGTPMPPPPVNPAAQAQARAAQQAKARAAAAKKAAEARARKKAEMEVRMVGQEQSRMNGFSNSMLRQSKTFSGTAVPGVVPPDNSIETAADNQNEREIRSPGQWRSYLNAVPTAKAAQEFLAAYKAREVDQATFYTFAKEYLADKEERYQKIGMYLLEQNPSVKSFAILVSVSDSSMTAETKAQVQKITQGYGEAVKFPVLNQILLVGTPIMVRKATDILQATLQAQANLRQNVESGSVRDARSPGSAPIAVSQFQIFNSSLRRLASSPEAEIAQVAQGILATIQSLKPA
jgi:hypothetical protein